MKRSIIITLAIVLLVGPILLVSCGERPSKRMIKEFVSAYFDCKSELLDKYSFVTYEMRLEFAAQVHHMTMDEYTDYYHQSVDDYYELEGSARKELLAQRYGVFTYSIKRVEIDDWTFEKLTEERSKWANSGSDFTIFDLDPFSVDKACDATITVRIDNEEGTRFVIGQMTLII